MNSSDLPKIGRIRDIGGDPPRMNPSAMREKVPHRFLHPEGNGAPLKSWDAGDMAPLADYETITPEERLRRIGRLLGKAAILALARREAEEAGAKILAITASHPPVETDAGADEGDLLKAEEQDLLRRARRLGGISPREASRLWKVSRATTYRRLMSMERQGWITRKGATTATRYGLTRQALDWLEMTSK